MATNIIRDKAEQMPLVVSHPASPLSGDAVRIGTMAGVALTDEGDGGNEATQTSVRLGFFVADILVDDNGGSGIAVYDLLYYHDTGTGSPTTSVNNSAASADAFVGMALETVAANGTAVIEVLFFPLPLMPDIA